MSSWWIYLEESPGSFFSPRPPRSALRCSYFYDAFGKVPPELQHVALSRALRALPAAAPPPRSHLPHLPRSSSISDVNVTDSPSAGFPNARAMLVTWSFISALHLISWAEPRCSQTAYYKNCWIRRFPGLHIDIEESQRRGAQLLERYQEESALKCSRACCLTRNFSCNLAVFHFNNTQDSANCVHLHCSTLESCILRQKENVILYNITKGVDPDLLVFGKYFTTNMQVLPQQTSSRLNISEPFASDKRQFNRPHMASSSTTQHTTSTTSTSTISHKPNLSASIPPLVSSHTTQDAIPDSTMQRSTTPKRPFHPDSTQETTNLSPYSTNTMSPKYASMVSQSSKQHSSTFSPTETASFSTSAPPTSSTTSPVSSQTIFDSTTPSQTLSPTTTSDPTTSSTTLTKPTDSSTSTTFNNNFTTTTLSPLTSTQHSTTVDTKVYSTVIPDEPNPTNLASTSHTTIKTTTDYMITSTQMTKTQSYTTNTWPYTNTQSLSTSPTVDSTTPSSTVEQTYMSTTSNPVTTEDFTTSFRQTSPRLNSLAATSVNKGLNTSLTPPSSLEDSQQYSNDTKGYISRNVTTGDSPRPGSDGTSTPVWHLAANTVLVAMATCTTIAFGCCCSVLMAVSWRGRRRRKGRYRTSLKGKRGSMRLIKYVIVREST